MRQTPRRAQYADEARARHQARADEARARISTPGRPYSAYWRGKAAWHADRIAHYAALVHALRNPTVTP